MRNLKKILALVLALVMTVSVMSVASAAYKDADKVSADFSEAVDVLSALGVFRGDEKGNFNPKGSITRAEVAAIIYRIDTGDVADEQVAIYADYNKFDDVKSTAWYAGYVNYCANALYIKGYDEHTFGPNDKVTGYQALAMILRAVGYDKNGEFSGSAWQVETAKYANALGITANVNANTLGVAATRELVAELLFRTIVDVPQVTYTLLKGYNQYKVDFITTVDPDELALLENDTIGEEMFGLGKSAAHVTIDDWGRPGYYWYVYGVESLSYAIVVYPDAPVNTYTVATTECEIALDLGLNGKNDITVDFWNNGVDSSIAINPIHEHVNVAGHLVGGQGTIIEVYEMGRDVPSAGYYDERIVMIETYLGVVTGTTKQVTDKAGHIITKASNEISVFAGADERSANGFFVVDSIAGNDYNVGEYVLVNVNEGEEYIEVKGLAKTVNGTQTTIWWNAAKHTLDKVEYADNENFCIDAAGYDMSKAYTWFLDEYNNLMGSVAIVTPKAYAVVVGAQWINGLGVNGYAQATIRYMDGTTETATLAKVNGVKAHYASYDKEATFDAAEICTTWQYNDDTNHHLYNVQKDENGSLYLTKVADHTPDVTIADGYSLIDGSSVYTDNNTVYVIYNTKTGAYDTYVGYDNIEAIYVCEDMDVVMNTATGFAKYVYARGYVYTQNPTVYAEEELIYFTGDMMNFYETKDTFALYGVVDAEGNTDALYFAKGADALATWMALNKMVEAYQDALCLVTTYAGIVINVEPIALGLMNAPAFDFAYPWNTNETYADYVEMGTYRYIATGVLEYAGLKLNVNATTTIINEGEIGTVVDLTYLNNVNLYVVHDGNFVSTIFITERTAPVTSNMVQFIVADMTVASLADVTASYTYEINADVALDEAAIEAAVAKAVREGAVLDNVQYNKRTVTADLVTYSYTDMTATLKVTITAKAAGFADVVKELTIVVKLVNNVADKK